MPSWYYDEVLKPDLSSFIAKTLNTVDPGARFLPNWHIDLIAEYLEAARRREITRLIINMPPRSLKSVCVSVAWPAWLLGHDPASRVMAASYAASLSIKHSVDCRLVVNAPWYRALFPKTVLTRDQNEKRKFMTTRRGYRFATSVGGSATGEGGNFLIIDDPMNPAQAMNAHWRNHINHWFDHTFASRLDDKKRGVIVLVMQRLHQDDLTGYLLAKGGWRHVCLPAVAAKQEVYDFGGMRARRAMGELLHPERENAALVERAKVELGSMAFAAQYQQQPVPDEGAMVRPGWFRRYRILPGAVDRWVQSWDTAIKSGGQHDASACLTVAECGGVAHVADMRCLRLEYPDLKRMFYALAEQWRPQAILIEDRASGQQLIQDVRRETALPVVTIRPQDGKITRFAAVSAMIEAGKVALPEEAAWLAGFESELYAFPGGTHDDQVDALTQYLDWLRGQAWQRLGIRSL